MEPKIFISYAHLDNKPLSGAEVGWISRFRDALEDLLDMRLGSESEVWRDDKLQGNDYFGPEILERLAESQVLVPVLSPRYLKSDWCTKEISEFCTLAQKRGGLAVGNKARVFKIIKTPVESQESLPEPTRELLGYEFFTYKQGAPLELDPAYGIEFQQQFNQQVAVLAANIAQLLESLDSDPTATPSATPSDPASTAESTASATQAADNHKPVVYLAECSFDCKPTRARLEAELLHLGYSVLPDQHLPNDEMEYVAAVEKMLARANLSVHIIGEFIGNIPDGPSAKSAVEHQNTLAAQRSLSSGMPRLIWMPEKLKSAQEAQQTFIKKLHTDREARRGADLIEGEFEVLRATMHTALKKIEDARRAPPAEPTRERAETDSEVAPLVYMIFDERDRDATKSLRKGLKAQGFEVTTPESEGDAAHVRQANQSKLAHCDAVLIYYGSGDEFWKRAVRTELRKMAGYRQDKPPPLVHTYVALPDTSDKSDMIADEPHVIDGRHAFGEQDLLSLSQALSPTGAVSERPVA